MNYEIRRVDVQEQPRVWGSLGFRKAFTYWMVLRAGRCIDTALSEERAWAQCERFIERNDKDVEQINIRITALLQSKEMTIRHATTELSAKHRELVLPLAKQKVNTRD